MLADMSRPRILISAILSASNAEATIGTTWHYLRINPTVGLDVHDDQRRRFVIIKWQVGDVEFVKI